MDRQEEYDKLVKNCKTWFLGTKIDKNTFLLERVLEDAYNLGKKHAREEREEELDGILTVSKELAKQRYSEALSALDSKDADDVKWGQYRIGLLQSLFGESILDIKHVKEKRVEALNLKGLDQASVIERGLTYLEENGKPVCVCYEGESKIRLQVATAAMQGLVINEYCLAEKQFNPQRTIKLIAEKSVQIADALIAEVSKKGGEE